ncbi:DNA-binding HxlR family transcriptional regulator [Diaminobutyricimonas aerilata]|uniref:DNA-binding HxlR family transcriptional regulator n=1 Tax=Diaminobutyricimonas aerilata TaxID=1162967 RepID=A0A2M9CHB4_9MICO|nr:helix-turn-helix domain-containing protein [Diaminobutyricimonas aerilata]PJJ71277.1 DNA-binding HxlR family transcriptional regulator [Diaminobutyricimonas aerilata]
MISPAERNARCSVARSLEVLGEKWTLLVVREALAGVTRFSGFRERLGIAPDILTARLDTLVGAGVLERRPYREAGRRQRDEYVLTDAGLRLTTVLAAFVDWGDAHRPSGHGPATVYVDRASGEPVRLAFLRSDGSELQPDRVATVPGPGALSAAG